MPESGSGWLTELDDRYPAERVLGTGGMATVWLVTDLRHSRKVALKVVRPELASAGLIERFQREILIAAGLQHPNILAVFDSGHAGDRLWYTMPWVDGESLRDRMRRVGRFTVVEAIGIARGIAAAIDHANTRGVIHRDIKPENVLLAGDHPLVADFGIARALTDDAHLTGTGMAIGTPMYMSPEQSMGSNDIDVRTDVYALACIVYEMLGGEPPYTGSSPQFILAKRLAGPVPGLCVIRPDLPPGVAAAVARGLARDREERFATANELIGALEAGKATPGQDPPAPTATRRSRAVVPGIAAALLIGAGLAWSVLNQGGGAGSAGSPTADISLAVLPFANLSPVVEQEFFSDGLTEEILNQLAQVPGLRLIGRTSSFSFKGRHEDLRAIGRKLGVDNLLEGSVRRDGDQLRVTAQLINSRDGSERWAKTYARELKDVFAVQEEIAREVARALSIRLDVGEMSRAQGGTTNLGAWEKFQQARQLLRQDEYPPAAPLLREAVALDPGFAIAWAGLWETLRYMVLYRPETELRALRAEMDQAAARAIQLAPHSWSAQWITAMQLREQHRWAEAEAAAASLLQAPLTAENVEKAWGAVFFYSSVGRFADLVQLMKRMQEIDPLSVGISGDITLGYLSDSSYDKAADAEYEHTKSLEGDNHNANNTALVRALANERADPAAVRAQIRVSWGDDADWDPFQRELYAKVHDREAARKVVRREWQSTTPSKGWARRLSQYADALGDRELTLTILESHVLKGDAQNLWWVPRSGVRSDPRFKQLLRGIGLADYFRTSGNWGDYCKPVGTEDFACS